MAATRTSSFKALRNLQTGSQTRKLHITGVQAAPSAKALDPSHKNTYMPMGLQELRNECRKRTLGASGTKHELIDRLATHDNLQARAFSIAMRRIAKQQTSKKVSGPFETRTRREFNTSRANKAVNDSSTIDFAYLPHLWEGEFLTRPAQVRVPILPSILSDDAEARLEEFPSLDAAAGGYQASEGGVAAIMKPEIETATQKTGAEMSHMSDVGDGQSHEMSVQTLSDLSKIVGENAQKLVEAVKDKDEGTIRKIWNGFLDDVFGAKSSSTKA